MKKLSGLLYMGLVLLWSACNSDSAAPKHQDVVAAPTPVPAPSEKPEVELYWITVDNLLLRDQPTRAGSKVVTKFKAGDFVEGTGVVSSNKEEATIRNIPMNEPYFQVVSTTPEQFKGWAFGGALQSVYAGARQNSPDLGKLSSFSLALNGLDPKKLESGKKAWDYVKNNFSDAKGSLADAAYIMLEFFLRRMDTEGQLYTLTEKVTWTDQETEAIWKRTFDPMKHPVGRQLAANGFDLETGEGMVFPKIDQRRLNEFFLAKVGPAFKAYLEQEMEEHKNKAWEDGGIIIPMEQVADRAVFWEKFNQDYPNFPLRAQTIESQRWTRLVLMNGDDNTPCYNTETNSADENFRKAWAYVMQKYPGSNLAKEIKKYTDLWAAEGWKRTPKIEEYQKQFVPVY